MICLFHRLCKNQQIPPCGFFLVKKKHQRNLMSLVLISCIDLGFFDFYAVGNNSIYPSMQYYLPLWKVRLPLHFKLQLQNKTLKFVSVRLNPIEFETPELLKLLEQTAQAVQAKTHKIKYVLMQLETHQLHAQNCFHLCFDRFYTFLPFYYFILTMLPCLLYFCSVSNAKSL